MKQINKIIYSSSKFIPNLSLSIDKEFILESYYLSFYSYYHEQDIHIYLSSIANFRYKNFKINIIEVVKDLVSKYYASN